MRKKGKILSLSTIINRITSLATAHGSGSSLSSTVQSPAISSAQTGTEVATTDEFSFDSAFFFPVPPVLELEEHIHEAPDPFEQLKVDEIVDPLDLLFDDFHRNIVLNINQMAVPSLQNFSSAEVDEVVGLCVQSIFEDFHFSVDELYMMSSDLMNFGTNSDFFPFFLNYVL